MRSASLAQDLGGRRAAAAMPAPLVARREEARHPGQWELSTVWGATRAMRPNRCRPGEGSQEVLWQGG